MCCNGEGLSRPAALVGGASFRGISNRGVSPPPPCRPEQEMTVLPRQGCPDLINIAAAARRSHSAVTGAARAAPEGSEVVLEESLLLVLPFLRLQILIFALLFLFNMYALSSSSSTSPSYFLSSSFTSPSSLFSSSSFSSRSPSSSSSSTSSFVLKHFC